MKALRLELRLVHDVTEADRAQLPKGTPPLTPTDAAWNLARTVAALIRSHVPDDATVYLLTGVGLEAGAECIPSEVEIV